MYLNRRVTLYCGSVAQLSDVVSTPSPDRAVALEREALLPTAGDSSNPVQVVYLHGRMMPFGGSIAQLAMGVPTPGPDRVICRDPQAVGKTAGKGGDRT